MLPVCAVAPCMIDRNNRYHGFSTTENMTADKIADFLDRMSLSIHKDSVVVLDNVTVDANL